MKREVIKIRDGEIKVTVTELTPRIVVDSIDSIYELFGDEKVNIKTLIVEKFDTAISLINNVVTIEGGSIEHLSFSEILAIFDVFKRVNNAFFRMSGLMGVAQAPSQTMLSEAISKAVEK